MNVNDVNEKPDLSNGIFRFIIGKQKGLMEKYHTIEEKTGIGYALVAGTNQSFDDQRWQYLYKDFAWRVTEELAESMEAFTEMMTREANREQAYTHTVEELIDALHFYSELLILCDIDSPIKVSSIITKEGVALIREPIEFFYKQPPYTIDEAFVVKIAKTIQFLGMAMNCLKQKPWKQTQMLTDVPKFKKFLVYGYWFLVQCFKSLRVDPEQIATFYNSKNAVNQFRQRSNY